MISRGRKVSGSGTMLVCGWKQVVVDGGSKRASIISLLDRGARYADKKCLERSPCLAL